MKGQEIVIKTVKIGMNLGNNFVTGFSKVGGYSNHYSHWREIIMPVSSLTKEKFSCLVYQLFIIISSNLGHQIFTDFVDYKHTIKRFSPSTIG